MKIAIIGAGISGLTVANQLTKHAEIKIFEKARGVGGRMSTRSTPDFQFDHGAQHFYVKTAAFKNFLKPLEEQKIVARWDADFCEIDFDKIVYRKKWSQEYPHFVATPKMNSLCKYLARGLDISLQTQVKKIVVVEKKWQVFDEQNNSLGIFDWVISSAPAEQTSELMPQCFAYLDVAKKTKMLGCFSLMLAFENPLPILWQAALVKNSKISWISLDSSKPQRTTQNCLVAHSTNVWAEAHLEDDINQIQQTLIAELTQVIGCDASLAKHANIHRWRYANAEKRYGKKALVDAENKLAVCGDWLIQGRIESAFESAVALVEEIKIYLKF